MQLWEWQDQHSGREGGREDGEDSESGSTVLCQLEARHLVQSSQQPLVTAFYPPYLDSREAKAQRAEAICPESS